MTAAGPTTLYFLRAEGSAAPTTSSVFLHSAITTAVTFGSVLDTG